MTAFRVLVVEDDAAIGPLLAETLIGLGYEAQSPHRSKNGQLGERTRNALSHLTVANQGLMLWPLGRRRRCLWSALGRKTRNLLRAGA